MNLEEFWIKKNGKNRKSFQFKSEKNRGTLAEPMFSGLLINSAIGNWTPIPEWSLARTHPGPKKKKRKEVSSSQSPIG